jgi:hypothetical protein
LDFKKSDTLKRKSGNQIDSQKHKKIYLSGFDEYENLESGLSNEKRKNDPYISIAKTHFGIEYFLQQFDKSILSNYLFPSNVNEKIFE